MGFVLPGASLLSNHVRLRIRKPDPDSGGPMALHLKRRIAQPVAYEMEIRSTVERILEDVRIRGDAAVREYSEKFDKWVPKKLSSSDIERIMARVRPETLADIKFAQSQIRNFAEHQRAALRDIEV